MTRPGDLGANLIGPETPILEAVGRMDAARRKLLLVVDGDRRLLGALTDGDIRRAFQRDISGLSARDIMSTHPITVTPEARMSDVVDLLTANKIANLFVVEDERPVAIVHIAELMQAGYVS